MASHLKWNDFSHAHNTRTESHSRVKLCCYCFFFFFFFFLVILPPFLSITFAVYIVCLWTLKIGTGLKLKMEKNYNNNNIGNELILKYTASERCKHTLSICHTRELKKFSRDLTCTRKPVHTYARRRTDFARKASDYTRGCACTSVCVCWACKEW